MEEDNSGYDLTHVIQSSSERAKVFAFRNGTAIFLPVRHIAYFIDWPENRPIRPRPAKFKIRKVIRLGLDAELVRVVEFWSGKIRIFLTADGNLWEEKNENLFTYVRRPESQTSSTTNGDIFDDLLGNETAKSYVCENDYMETFASATLSDKHNPLRCLRNRNFILDIFAADNQLLALVKHENHISLYGFVVDEENKNLASVLSDLSKHKLNELCRFSCSSLEIYRSTCFKILECMQSAKALSTSLHIGDKLYSLLFGIDKTLLGRSMLMLGLPSGKVNAVPMQKPKQVETGSENRDVNRSAITASANTLFDLQEPVSDIFAMKGCDAQMKEFESSSVAAEDIISVSKKELTKVSALIIVGKLGKILIVLPQGKKFHSSTLNWGQIASTVICCAMTGGFCICSTGNQVLVYRFVIEIRIQTASRPQAWVYPNLDLVISIPSPSIVSFSDIHKTEISRICLLAVSKDVGLLEISFLCPDTMEKPYRTPQCSEKNLDALLREREELNKQLVSSTSLLKSQNIALSQIEATSHFVAASVNCQCHQNSVPVSLTRKSMLTCDLVELNLSTNRQTMLRFSLRNNSNYRIPNGSKINCMIRNSNKCLSQVYNSNKQVFLSFQVPVLLESNCTYDHHAFVEDADLWEMLPFKLSFSLVIHRPDSVTSLYKDCHCLVRDLVVPLNECDVTNLNFYTAERTQTSKAHSRIINAKMSLPPETSRSSCKYFSENVLAISSDCQSLMLRLPISLEGVVTNKFTSGDATLASLLSSNQYENDMSCKFKSSVPFMDKMSFDIVSVDDNKRKAVLMKCGNISICFLTHQAICGHIKGSLAENVTELTKSDLKILLQGTEACCQPILDGKSIPEGRVSELMQRLFDEIMKRRTISFPSIRCYNQF